MTQKSAEMPIERMSDVYQVMRFPLDLYPSLNTFSLGHGKLNRKCLWFSLILVNYNNPMKEYR